MADRLTHKVSWCKRDFLSLATFLRMSGVERTPVPQNWVSNPAATSGDGRVPTTSKSYPPSAVAAHLPDRLKNQNRKLKGRFLNSDSWRE